MQQLPLGVRLPDRAVFASFLTGRNAQAVVHLQRLAAGGEGGGLTWLCGPAGCGKSHLLQGAGTLAGERMRSGYVPLAQVATLGPGILEGLTQMQCLCLDDLQHIAGRPEWERADLGSRCAAGVVFQLRALDEQEQHAALQLRARLRGLELPLETWQWLQRRLPRDMRTLHQLLDTLDEASLAAQRRLTVPFIREVLRAAAPDGD